MWRKCESAWIYCVKIFLLNGSAEMLNKTYGLTGEIKSFAVDNGFVEMMNKGCYELGKVLKPFCIFADDVQRNHGVIDLALFNGIVDEQKTLIDEIAYFRMAQYTAAGIFGISHSAESKKALFLDYLMTVSICYVEIPKYITREGIAQKSYDKFLATRNPALAAAWMGTTVGEMQAKYSNYLTLMPTDFCNEAIRVIKLNATSKGNTASKPRTTYSTKEMRCTPLFMIYAFMMGCLPKLNDKIVKFVYLKDNGTERELATTVNRDILMDYYNDAPYVDGVLAGTDIFSMNQGGMNLSSKQSRGYVRVPELGASRYDGTGVRALNLVRILSAKEVEEVDRTFIDVDLSSVVSNFGDCLDYAVAHFPDKLGDIYEELGVEADGVDSKSSSSGTLVKAMKDYAETTQIIMSTTFQRQLHLFMASNPQWFPLYTGKPNAKTATVSSVSFGVGVMDF